jgi:Ca2+/Na+ antiporter
MSDEPTVISLVNQYITNRTLYYNYLDKIDDVDELKYKDLELKKEVNNEYIILIIWFIITIIIIIITLITIIQESEMNKAGITILILFLLYILFYFLLTVFKIM